MAGLYYKDLSDHRVNLRAEVSQVFLLRLATPDLSIFICSATATILHPKTNQTV